MSVTQNAAVAPVFTVLSILLIKDSASNTTANIDLVVRSDGTTAAAAERERGRLKIG
jgi:hypothetical protein